MAVYTAPISHSLGDDAPALPALRPPDRDSYFRLRRLRVHYEGPFEEFLISSEDSSNPSSSADDPA